MMLVCQTRGDLRRFRALEVVWNALTTEADARDGYPPCEDLIIPEPEFRDGIACGDREPYTGDPR